MNIFEARPCPVCGDPCSFIYIDKYGDVVGCDVCVTERDVCEWTQECIEDELADVADKRRETDV